MTVFLFYLLKVIVCSALFAGCYWWMLCNRGFYHWNRFHIVASVALSIIIPLLDISIPVMQKVIPSATYYTTYFVMDHVEEVAVPVQATAPSFNWEWTGWIFFVSIVLSLLVKEIISFARILRLKRCSERICIPETVLYCTDDASAPFTFFRNIFWKKGISVDSGEGRCMLRHELAHVRLGHCWDKALMQFVCCIFWMNPFFILFRRELELVHEFAADSESSAEELSSLILCTLYPNYYHDFTSRFSQSSIKRRIFMITENKKSKLNMLRKMSIVPVALVAMYLFACNSEGRRDNVSEIAQPLSESVWQKSWTPQNNLEEPVIVVGYGRLYEDVKLSADVMVTHTSERAIARWAISYDEVEEKPVFQGEGNNFRRHLAFNLVYPPVAQENGITGTVVVSFIVEKDGTVTDVKSPVKIDLLSKELERVVKSSPAWKPGKQGGKDVAVQCYAFVEFRFDTPTTSNTEDEEAIMFALVEVKPTFNGMDAEAGLREYVSKNTVYPPEAQEKGITGRVYVEFTINKDGSVSDAKLLRGVDPLLDNEALRVISASPKWTPGKHGGKPVKLKYVFPINFQLNSPNNN